MCTAASGLAASRAAREATVASSSSAATTWLSRPSASPRSASEALAEQHQLPGAQRPHLRDETRHRAPGERDAEVHLGDLEQRPPSGHAPVAGQGEDEPAADRVAVHARDRDRLARLDRLDGAQPDLRGEAPLAHARAVAGRAGRVATVGAGAERRPATAEHHHPDLEIGREPLEDLRDLAERARVEGVAPLGTVQPHRRHGGGADQDQRFQFYSARLASP
jgi:hypothetical protein